MNLAPCRPRNPLPSCAGCDRYTERLPHSADQRPKVVLMDVAAILKEGQRCPMVVSKPEALDWWLGASRTVSEGVVA